MKVKVHKNAASNYHRRCYKGAHPSCGMLHNPDWEKKLKAVEGQWLEVETDHLFDDQFNTVPVPEVSESGLRLMVTDITEIQDDIRLDVVKCRWCGGYDTTGKGTCDNCGKSDYLFDLNPKFPKGASS